MKTVLEKSRYMMVLATLGSFIASLATLIYGLITVVQIILKAFTSEIGKTGAKQLSVDFLTVVDIFLLASILYIVALGLYELFVDESLQLPGWLEITHINDLKVKLLGVVVVMISISFLAEVTIWDGDTDILAYGVAVALVLAAIAYASGIKFGSGGGSSTPE
ncbi:MAG: YqhA family protein [Pleurocapsa minor GSE-CHR-MK-17-07R]|nr:YqhA family protein [Pleurocapsa minor GSE-CHR-MK 17-07R]